METPIPSATGETIAEHIPWQQLTVPASPARGRALYLLAGAVALLVVGVVIGRAIGAASAAPPGASGDAAEPVRSSLAESSLPLTLAPLSAPATTSPLREADLLAAPPIAAAQAAVARAEWFITDYFSIDQGADRPARVVTAAGWRATLAADLEDPIPDTVISYVEWARATVVRQIDAGLYDVSVVFRRYVATDGTSFTRLPVEAAAVEVRVGAEGASSVVGWPRWVEVPGGVASAEPPTPPDGTIVDGAGVKWPVAS